MPRPPRTGARRAARRRPPPAGLLHQGLDQLRHAAIVQDHPSVRPGRFEAGPRLVPAYEGEPRQGEPVHRRGPRGGQAEGRRDRDQARQQAPVQARRPDHEAPLHQPPEVVVEPGHPCRPTRPQGSPGQYVLVAAGRCEGGKGPGSASRIANRHQGPWNTSPPPSPGASDTPSGAFKNMEADMTISLRHP